MSADGGKEYERLSKEDLLAELQALLAERETLREGASKAAEHERLVHELRVHQVELEMQNRNLLESHDELVASRARYADLYELAPVAYFSFDERGSIQEVNLRGAAMLAMDRRQILGAPFVAMVRLDDASAFFSLLRRCFEGRTRAEGELRFSVRGGAPAIVHAEAEPVMDAAGSVVSCRLAFADVSRLEAAEGEAKRALDAERRLRDSLDAITRAHEAVSAAIADRPKGLLHVLQVLVDHARALVGAEYAALGLGGHQGEPFDPWTYSGISEAKAKALGGAPRSLGVLAAGTRGALRLRDLREHPAFHGFPEGHPSMRSFLAVPIHRLGRPVGTLFAANKVGADEFTEDDAKALETLATRVAAPLEIARLREAEARAHAWARAVVQQMPEAVAVIGEEPSGVPSFNAAAEALFGVPADHRVEAEVLTPAGTRLRDDELPHVRASRGETISGLELRIRRPDGTLIPVVASAAPVSDGKPGAAVAVYRDVSAEKELEREREAWTGIVAHDLRQPTSVISFSAQLLARYGDGLGPREAKSVERIASAARTLSRMIDDLLDVTMIEAQRLKLSLSSVDVAALVREVVDRSRPAYEGRRVDIRTPAAAFVQADADRVAQVVTNLVSNAVKYSSPASSVDVQVERKGGVVRVAVGNHGTGLTAEERQRIFQRFYRTRAAHDGAVGGLGLGLYISKGIVEAHGGQMGVESVPGQTTTFWFRLPERSEGAPLGS